MMSLPVFYAFARSGGTLLNRCLGCISGNLVLSEINPHASVVPIEQQAKNWLHLLTDQQVADLKQKSYGDKISYLATLAHEQGYHLIIRDWVTANFLNNVIPDQSSIVPSHVLEQNCYLTRCGLKSHSVVITRRAADVYESITRTFKHLQDLPVEAFGSSYLAYAKSVCHYPVFHYEQLCQEPEKIVQDICRVLNVDFDTSFTYRFSQFTQCTGDTTLPQPSRGIQLEKITPLKSNHEALSYIAASQNLDCQIADKLLNYAS
jgi:hypothetical protein